MIYVIGTGPAGVSAATALAKARNPVTLLDVGHSLESEPQLVVTRMSLLDKAEWQTADLETIRERMKSTTKGVRLKYAFGSDFPYRDAEKGIGLVRRNADLVPSYALGGLSNVWGAAIMSNLQTDIEDWPVTIGDLAPHYRAVHQFMPLAAVHDNLAEKFPLYSEPSPVPISAQAKGLLEDLQSHPISGLQYGRSRLAVKSACTRCGLCMYGCPYGYIYNSAETVRWLVEQFGVRYQPGVIVRRLEERNGQVVIEASTGRQRIQLTGDRVFLAAGVLSSTRIVLESQEAEARPVPVRDSQYYLFPLIRTKREPGASREQLHTLSQVFLEIHDPAISPFTIHLQCYTYNDLYPEVFRSMLGPLVEFLPLNIMIERLVLVQGYLHSAHSPPMKLTLKNGSLQLLGQQNQAALVVIRKVMKTLRPLGLALNPVLTKPGRGFHSGGTLPMRYSPAPLETDTLGRPYGLEKVHVVDASVLPSIPATTITYTAMANAHRIASHYDRAVSSPRRHAPRVAITGANGYVGGALADFLSKQGLAVVSLVRQPLGAAHRFCLGEVPSPEALRGVEFLVHAAYDFLAMNPAAQAETNIEGSRKLLEAASDAGIRHGVFISSLSAFSGCTSLYGRTKLVIENIAREIGWDIVRPGLVYGPRPGGMIQSLQNLARHRVIPLVDDGSQIQYLAHQEDLGRLVYHLLSSKGSAPRTVPAAHSSAVTMRSIISEVAPVKPVFISVPWRLIWAGLKCKESIGLKSRLSSDSLISLLNPPPVLDFTALKMTGIEFQPFGSNARSPLHERPHR